MIAQQPLIRKLLLISSLLHLNNILLNCIQQLLQILKVLLLIIFILFFTNLRGLQLLDHHYFLFGQSFLHVIQL